MDLQYKGKNILVTAASRGLGKACAIQLAKEGANVIISSRNPESLAKTATEIKDATGQEVITIPTDVSSSESINLLFKEIGLHTDQLHGVICNAGGPPTGGFLSFNDEDWEKAFETNILSVVRILRHAVPMLENNGGGRTVTIASSSVKVPIPGLILSNTMRTGVQGLMKTLSLELAEKGILVNTVCPGRIATDRLQELDGLRANKEGKSIEQVQSEIQKEIPLGRYGRPEEFAELVSYLLSPTNTYLTGSTYMVDGGMVKSL
jgi:3-oxoacyl-[acyl-carrier protein] reductase